MSRWATLAILVLLVLQNRQVRACLCDEGSELRCACALRSDTLPFSGISFAIRLSQTHSPGGYSSSVVSLLADLTKLVLCCGFALTQSHGGHFPKNVRCTFPSIVPAILVR